MKVDMSNAHIHMTLRSRHRPCLLSEALLVDKHGPIWNIPMAAHQVSIQALQTCLVMLAPSQAGEGAPTLS